MSKDLSANGIFCTSTDLLNMVVKAYPQPAWTVLAELRDGTGFSTRGQSCDAMAFGTWPSRGLQIIGFEFKTYRSDWLRELKNPQKAEKFSGYCDQWWLVTGSDGVAKLEEIPASWGWAVGTPKGLKTMKSPSIREPGVIDRLFFMSIIRNVAISYVPANKLEELAIKKFQDRIDSVTVSQKYEIDCLKRDVSSLEKRIKDFEEASGIEIGRYCDGKEIGRIVKAVRDGSLRWQIQSVVNAARMAKEVLDAVESLGLYQSEIKEMVK